jgi:hypothetical protein
MLVLLIARPKFEWVANKQLPCSKARPTAECLVAATRWNSPGTGRPDFQIFGVYLVLFGAIIVTVTIYIFIYCINIKYYIYILFKTN